MKETRDGYLHGLDGEDASLAPNRFEIKIRHDERQVDFEAVPITRADGGASLDDSPGEPMIARRIKRLVAAPQFETSIFACAPAPDEILRICGKEEIAILGVQHEAGGLGVVICGPDAHHDISHVVSAESAHKREKRIHADLPLTDGGGEVPVRHMEEPMNPRLVGARLVTRKRLDDRDASKERCVELYADGLRLLDGVIEHPKHRVQLRIHPAIILSGHADLR